MDRRAILSTAALAMGAATLATHGEAAPARTPIGAVTARDGTSLFVRDWGAGAPVVFVHSWAMNADMWDYQMADFAARGLRVVAYDRRGHGRSGEPSGGYDADTLADDLATVMDRLDLRGATLVAHSMGAGEAVRYLGRHGAKRVSRLVLLAPTTPCLLKTTDNPQGLPEAAFEHLRTQWMQDRTQWMADNAAPFVVPETPQAMRDWLTSLMLRSSLHAWIACNKAMVQADFRPDLRAIGVPTLVIHGDKDASAPIDLTGRPTAQMIPGAQLRVYAGAPHGLFVTHKERLNAELLAFRAA